MNASPRAPSTAVGKSSSRAVGPRPSSRARMVPVPFHKILANASIKASGCPGGKRVARWAASQRYTPDQTDYKSVVTKLVSKKADVLYAGGYVEDIGIIIRQAKKELPNLLLFSGDGIVNIQFLYTAGDAGVGTYFTFGPDLRLKPRAQEVAAPIREEDAYEPERYTLYSYGTVQVWAQAVNQAGSFKPKAVINALRTGSFDTVMGKIGFDKKGDVTGFSTFVWYVFGKEDYSPVK